MLVRRARAELSAVQVPRWSSGSLEHALSEPIENLPHLPATPAARICSRIARAATSHCRLGVARNLKACRRPAQLYVRSLASFRSKDQDRLSSTTAQMQLACARVMKAHGSFSSAHESPTDQCRREKDDESYQDPGVTRAAPRGHFLRPRGFLPACLLNHLG